jgi:hypothetical protein
MKRTKIILTAVGLLSVVGGALAFKAHRVTGTYLCATTTKPIAQCLVIATTTNVGPSFTSFCTNDPLATQCSRRITKLTAKD